MRIMLKLSQAIDIMTFEPGRCGDDAQHRKQVLCSATQRSERPSVSGPNLPKFLSLALGPLRRFAGSRNAHGCSWGHGAWAQTLRPGLGRLGLGGSVLLAPALWVLWCGFGSQWYGTPLCGELLQLTVVLLVANSLESSSRCCSVSSGTARRCTLQPCKAASRRFLFGR